MSDSSKAKKRSYRKVKCRSCGGPPSTLEFDVHSTCQRCRMCSQDKPCGVCSTWSTEEWKVFTAWQDSLARKTPLQKDYFQDSTTNPQNTTSTSNQPMLSPGPPPEVNVSTVNSGASDDLLSSSRGYDRPIPASSEQPSLHRFPDEFRAYPQRPASFHASPWSYFQGDPRHYESAHPSTGPYTSFMPPMGHFTGYYPQERPPDNGSFSRSGVRPLPRNTDFSRRYFQGDNIGDRSEFQRSRSRRSRSRSRSPIRPGSPANDPRSLGYYSPGRYSRSGSSPRSSVGSDFDLVEPGITSMFHRGKAVIPEVSSILQFPPPSPKEASPLSFRRDSAQPTPPPKFTVPVDSFCSENIEEAFSIFQKRKHLRIPARESSLFKTNSDDTDRFFTVPTISSTVKDKLRSDKPTGKNIFSDKRTRDLNSSLEKLDRQLRYGAQVPNLSILLSDTLARASEDPATVDPEPLPVMFKFLDDCLGSCLRTIATSSAMTTSLL